MVEAGRRWREDFGHKWELGEGGAGTIGSLGSIDRRKFIALGGMSAAALILGAGPLSEKTWARPSFRDDPFSPGVASGDPLPHGVVIWTRLAPDPLAADGSGGMPDRKLPVRWEVAADDGFRKVVRRGQEFATPELAHSVHAEVDGLDPAPRDRLLNFLYRRKISNPVVLTGDWPANWLCDLKTDFDEPGSPAVGTEFVGTSITSTDYLGAEPAYGQVALEENPHIRYFNNERGYVRCRLTPDEWRTDYSVVPYIKRPGAPVRTRASFVIEEGNPSAHQVGGARLTDVSRAVRAADGTHPP